MSEIDHIRFRLIYESYWDKVYRYALKILSEEALAQDMVQQVFLSLWERRADVKIENVEAYLIQSAKFACMNQLRKKVFDSLDTSSAAMNASVAQRTDENLEYKDLKNSIEKILKPVSAKGEEMFRMRVDKGLDNRTIAAQMSISEKTVRNKLSETLKLVRDKLKFEGYGPGKS